jgi:CDP-glucose 4,6-dehydratase
LVLLIVDIFFYFLIAVLENRIVILEKIYKNKTILITGHTGFKGSWLSLWLHSLGANVVGLSNGIPSQPSNYSASKIDDVVHTNNIDIRDYESVKKLVINTEPDFIFHLAAQSLVRPSYDNPLDTISTNLIGTANILESVKLLNKNAVVVMITSDKAYDNVEWVWGYRETDRLGGKDPYSASKGMAELAIRSYTESFFNTSDSHITLGVARAGNVIGGGDWAKDRIVPDCMSAWSKGDIVEIRNPNATRPWQHVLEPLSGYLILGANLHNNKKNHGEAYNFGPSANQNYPVSELIEQMAISWDKVRWKDTSKKHKHLHEAGLLKLNCDKALLDLNWEPTLQFDNTVKMTIDWYKRFYDKDSNSMFNFTLLQIEEYVNFAKSQNKFWAI